MSSNNFSVDLHGMVELLSNHLYSGPHVFIRELLQNGVDALTARHEADSSEDGTVTFALGQSQVGRPTIAVTDTGLGLTASEAEQFMSVIGRSSKRDEIGMARESLIGQFGVGILSCFTVSETITVTSRSWKGSSPIQWVGKADGTWSLEELDESHPQEVGSTVTLTARPGEDRYFEKSFVANHLAKYGEMLNTKIWLTEPGQTPQLISRDLEPLKNPENLREAALQVGEELFGFRALDVFKIGSAVGQATGVAYVLPFEPAPNSLQTHRVYVKGMLVSEATERILPDWTFFVRCVIFGDGLNPTASREELHRDETLALTRDELGASVRAHLIELANSNPEALRDLISVHHLSMKALAIHDHEFLELVVDWLPFETSEGRLPFGEFRRRHPVAAYTDTVEEFRQLSPIASAQGLGLLSGGYVHDVQVIEAAGKCLSDFTANRVEVDDLFGGFGELDEAESKLVAPLLDAVTEPIESFGVQFAVRRFEPAETPGLLALDEISNKLRWIRRSQEQTNPLFADLVESAAETLPTDSRPIFCLNVANPIVQKLCRSGSNKELLTRSVEVLYLQALLMGQHPLGLSESALLNNSLSAVIEAAMLNNDDSTDNESGGHVK